MKICVVFEITKTKKKIFLFDEHYQIIKKIETPFEHILINGSLSFESLSHLIDWLKISFKNISQDSDYEVVGLNFTIFETGVVFLNAAGELGDYLGNSSQEMKYSLSLPQYFSFLFSAISVVELQQKIQFSSNIASRVGSISVGIGRHSGPSALLIFMKYFTEKFILLSTGASWTISMNPFNNEALIDSELQKKCSYFTDFEGRLVKFSRLFAGDEHNRQTKHLANYFEKEIGYEKRVKYDQEMIWFLRNKFKQATPETADIGLLKDCPFVERNLNLFKSYEEAYHQFMLDLVAQQVASLNLVMGWSKPKYIFIDGFFSHNNIYMSLLAETYFNKEVFAVETTNTAALGAALSLHEYWNSQAIPQQLIALKRYF